MKLASLLFGASFLSVFSLMGCSADVADDAEGEEAVEVEEAAVTGAPSNHGYFIVTRRDFRKCMSPLCGGFYVKRVNEAKTRCADGTLQDECYVSSIQLGGVGLSAREEQDFRGALESGKALVKARTYKTKFNGLTLGVLKANEAWLGATGSTPDGTFMRAASNGIVCITAPCPSTSVYPLNGGDSHNVIAVHLDNTASPASQEDLDRAMSAIGTKEGVLLAGGVAVPKCMPGSNCGPFAMASEFYLRVQRRENKSCGARGTAFCNAGQYCNWAPADICGAADAAGKCSYKPDFCTKEYAPVCACNGQTYSNACMAAAAGASVSSAGACAAPPAPVTQD